MRRTRTTGFTLVELMITVAIVAILLAIAFPSFEGSMRSNRVATGTNELLASLSLARSEAIRNPGGAGMCASADGIACDDDWNDGWIVWIDVNGNGDPDDGERIVRHVQANPRLAFNVESPTGGDPDKILFDSRGRVADNDTYGIDLQPDECPTGHGLVRNLILNATGQVHVAKDGCA